VRRLRLVSEFLGTQVSCGAVDRELLEPVSYCVREADFTERGFGLTGSCSSYGITYSMYCIERNDFGNL
jgi:hypothetical protein